MSGTRRAQVAMTPDEVAAFLADHSDIVIATIGPTGAPHLLTVNYGLLEGDVVFWTYAKSQKIVNLRRDERITCLLESVGSDYSEIQGVQITGRAHLVEDRDELVELGRAVVASVSRSRPMPDVYDPADPQQSLVAMSAKRAGVRVRAERVLSWDHRKLNGIY